MTAVEQIKELFSQPKKVAITTHQKPDADAMGSSLALKQYLEKKGHSVTVVVPTDYAPFLNWMHGNKEVLIYNKEKHQDSKTIFDDSDVIFTLDFNSLSRISELGEIVRESSATTILVDHHQQPDDIATYLFSDTSICSTCQMVYHFLEMLDDVKAINIK